MSKPELTQVEYPGYSIFFTDESSLRCSSETGFFNKDGVSIKAPDLKPGMEMKSGKIVLDTTQEGTSIVWMFK